MTDSRTRPLMLLPAFLSRRQGCAHGWCAARRLRSNTPSRKALPPVVKPCAVVFLSSVRTSATTNTVSRRRIGVRCVAGFDFVSLDWILFE